MPAQATINNTAVPITKPAPKVNPDLDKERKSCSFNVDELAIWWNGGELKLKEKRERGKWLRKCYPRLEKSSYTHLIKCAENYGTKPLLI